MSGRLSHVDRGGRARMVDVGSKPVTRRVAVATAVVRVGRKVAAMIRKTGGVTKGGVIPTARLAGIQGAKRASDLVPLAHPIPLDWIDVDARLGADRVTLTVEVCCTGRTGVEVEAMTGAAVAALAVYDMCKAASRSIEIESVRLLEKSGGVSGSWKRAAGRGS